MLFPKEYSKPVLQNIVEASENGWNATCGGGNTPGSGTFECSEGNSAGVGKGSFDGRLYTNPDNSSRLLDPVDVGGGQ
jgi:hypothetical protein